MKTLSRTITTLALAACLTTGLFANGLNLNGFGARATAMGGAFVGLADDFTAVFWNPAGLALSNKATFGLAGDILMPSAKYTLGAYSMETKSKMYPAGLLGYFQPIGENIVVGVGAYTLSGLGAAWDNTGLEAALISPLPPAAFTPPVEAYKWESFIGSVTIAPSIAVKVSDMFYLGASFNINYGFFKLDQWGEYMMVAPPAPPAGNLAAPPALINFGQRTLDVKGWGFGATFGVLVKPAEWISLGATFRTQSKINLSGTTELQNINLLGLPVVSDTEMSVVSPMWIAGGIALKPIEGLTLTLDGHYTNWSKLDEITLEFQDPAWAAGLGEGTLLLNWANKTQIRTGFEYDFGMFALRGGYYYDPAPAPDATLNILTPSFTFNSIAGGFGFKSGGLKVDLALEYLMGKDRTVALSGDNLPGHYEMNILVPMIALSYQF